MVSWRRCFPPCQACFYLCHSQPCPARQIRQSGRPVAGKVTSRQLGQSFVAPKPGVCGTHSSSRVKVCCLPLGTPKDQPVLRRPHGQMVAALAGGGDVGLLQQLLHFFTGQLLTALQRFGEQLFARAKVGSSIQTGGSGRRPDHPWREEGKQPPDMVPGDEMERATHRPGAHNGVIGNRCFDVVLGGTGHAQPDRPECAAVVLGLQGA